MPIFNIPLHMNINLNTCVDPLFLCWYNAPSAQLSMLGNNISFQDNILDKLNIYVIDNLSQNNTTNAYVKMSTVKSNALNDPNVNALLFIPNREIPHNCYVFNNNGSVVSNNTAFPLKFSHNVLNP